MATETFTVTLEGLRFYSRIGLFEQERIVGNDFEVCCHITYPASLFRSEDLSSGISYADVFDIIKETMGEEWFLLETATSQIASRCKEKWPVISEINVEISKITPPIPGITGSCAVAYKKKW
ncbi:MAG: dihydroneopterin aldolase [Muribaculaceae bacterium]|nr:dihydroneopterin aldolase [Muribaculaceae bacterium]